MKVFVGACHEAMQLKDFLCDLMKQAHVLSCVLQNTMASSVLSLMMNILPK